MRRYRLSLLLLLVTTAFCFPSRSAEFVPSALTPAGVFLQPHWLNGIFAANSKRSGISKACESLLAGETRWVTERFLDAPERGVILALTFAEGGSISNQTPYDFHFSFSPQVFVKLGEKLFGHYSSVPSLSLEIGDLDPPYTAWEGLFSKRELAHGFSQIRKLKLSLDALPALARSQSFPNLESLTVEAKKPDQIIAVLESGGFPKLRRLSLIATELSAVDLGRLLAQPSFSQITEISFEMMNFGDEGLQVLANSPAFANITALGLEASSRSICPGAPTEEGLKQLLQSPHLGGLRKLAVSSIWQFGPQAVTILSAWSGLTKLEHLELTASNSEQDIAQLIRTRNLERLEDLRLEGVPYDDRLLDALSQNKSLTSLKRVVVDLDPDISNDAVMAASRAPHLHATVIAYSIK